MEEFVGQRERSLLYYYQGYNYRRDNKSLVTVAQYRCAKKGCPGRASHPKGSPQAVSTRGGHNHPKDDTKFKTHEFKKALKEKSLSDLNESLKNVYHEVANVFPEASPLSSPKEELRRLHRIRGKRINAVPATMIALRDQLYTRDFDKFSTLPPLADQEEHDPFFQNLVQDLDGKTSLIFGSSYMLQRCLKPAKKLIVNAYRALMMPPNIKIVLTIHACHGVVTTQTFPVMFILMEEESKSAFHYVLKFVKDQLQVDWDPNEVIADFNIPLREALKEMFSNADVSSGSLFHYVQAVEKMWSRHGLHRVPVSVKEAAHSLRKTILALPFAPAEEIKGIFNTIDDTVCLALRSKVELFLKQFQKMFLNETRYFEPSNFSVFNRPEATCNSLCTLNSRLHAVSSSNIWVFINQLNLIAGEERGHFARYNSGLDPIRDVPLKFLLEDAKVVQARGLYAAKRLDASQLVNWCRQPMRDMSHVIRQGRKIRRVQRATALKLEYNDIATSSDSSIGSSRQSEPDQADVISLPASDNSIWDVEEEVDPDVWIEDEDEATEPLPIVQVAHQEIEGQVRAPRSCIACLEELASVVALPCTHALGCQGCKDEIEDLIYCPVCRGRVTSFMNFIPT